MKAKYIIIILLIAFTNTSKAQLETYILNADESTSFYDIQAGMHPYLDSLKLVLDSSTYYSGDGEYRNFRKFEKFWTPRVDQDGKFGQYTETVKEYYANTRDDYSYFNSDEWHEIGPNKNNNVGIGPTEFLTFFDNGTDTSTKYMLTGSLTGGLFYSVNSGISWNHGGTNNWDQSGCSSAVFHPTDYKTWFASSSGNSASGRSGWIGRTGGVYRTTCMGDDWVQIGDNGDFGT